jgi:hypothetical protein
MDFPPRGMGERLVGEPTRVQRGAFYSLNIETHVNDNYNKTAVAGLFFRNT